MEFVFTPRILTLLYLLRCCHANLCVHVLDEAYNMVCVLLYMENLYNFLINLTVYLTNSSLAAYQGNTKHHERKVGLDSITQIFLSKRGLLGLPVTTILLL